MIHKIYSNVKLNKDLGCYFPAFFKMNVSFPFWNGFSAMLDMPIKDSDLSVFVHEYIHFLQDISTGFGLYNSYVYSEYIHAAVNIVYKVAPQNNNKFKVPLTIPRDYYNVDLNMLVHRGCVGGLEQLDSFFPINVIEKDEKVDYTNPYLKSLKKVYIKGAGGVKLQFGYMAIMESMAYLIEKMITHVVSKAPDFPYTSAEMVVDLTYQEFGTDKLNIIALCDMSMQFPNPGQIFYQSLKEFKKGNFLPSKPEDVVDYFYNKQLVQMGNSSNIILSFIQKAFMVGDTLKGYLKGEEFKSFRNVIHSLLGFAIDMRINHKHFFIDLVRDGYAVNNKTLKDTIRTIGTPIIMDSNEDFWKLSPSGVKPDDYNIEIFAAICELKKLFEEGNDICEMLEWCQMSPSIVVDDRCIDKPWLRCNDQNLCPYALLWRHWNLGKYTPEK